MAVKFFFPGWKILLEAVGRSGISRVGGVSLRGVLLTCVLLVRISVSVAAHES